MSHLRNRKNRIPKLPEQQEQNELTCLGRGSLARHGTTASYPMAELGTPPPGTDLAASKYSVIVAAYSATWALGAIAVALRVLCRRLTKHRLWLDDWLIIAAVVLNHGLGRHVWAAPPDATNVWAKAGILGSLCYTSHTILIKLSILALYWRFFSIEDSIRPLIWILFGIVCSWGVAVVCSKLGLDLPNGG
ncbi:hypothetical protein VFPPC_11980 [Pochonia chlamydosporia 170]|uniref:Rhodopsin domain-containing protein n=1 Tax=Pochonia chlamydosporia 170 TaxID=1380566 RepID=A0A179EWC6_METCM|nr:hypothetical protein VFPPC_11980 [Pochonia chlamydosporia 170]OAQ57484.1 hypothetical protein VFPPC_11980 [Pochonia chlamydosporia 170]